MLLLSVVVLAAACNKGDATFTAPDEPQPAVLTIYVYAPEQAMATRADIGDVPAIASENRVHSLQIWVFEHASTSLVGYLNPSTNLLNSELSEAYLMDVDGLFAETHPNVDVYVLANAVGMGLGPSSSRSTLEAAVMPHGSNDYFGVSRPTSAVPSSGLPMSGVLRDQPIYGENPVLRIGSATEMATVKLKRLVSKLRFVFTRSTDTEDVVSINTITLAPDMLPTEEYLFLGNDGKDYYIGTVYETSNALLADDVGEIAACDEPSAFIFADGMEASKYEAIVENGVMAGLLTQAGPYYMRESDRRLEGTISYSVNGKTRQATFQMARPGDFTRNHTWVVYGYFMSSDSGDLQLNSVFVKDWINVNRNHEFFNW